MFGRGPNVHEVDTKAGLRVSTSCTSDLKDVQPITADDGANNVRY